MVESTTVKAIKYILLAGGIISLVLFVLSAVVIASYPFGLDFGEGYLLEHSRRMGAGENIYGDINSYPYTACNYPPMYPFISGLLMNIGGISLAPGRWVSIISTLVSCWLIGFILLRLTRDQLLSVALGMMYVSIPAVFRWGQVMRVDALAVLLSLAGLAIYMAAQKQKHKLWCIPFFIAAFLTKQSMLAAPIAVLAHRFIADRKSGTLFAGLTIACGAVLYLLIDMGTGWGLHRHNFAYTANAFYLERLSAGFHIYISYTAPVLIIALFHLVSGRSSFHETPVPLYFILATATLLTYGYEGSDRNYFIEPFAAALLMAGIGINAWMPDGANRYKAPAWVAAFLLVLMVTQLFMIRGMRYDEFSVMHVGKMDAEQGHLLVSLIKNTPGDVISEDASFQILAGKPVVFEPYIMTLLAERGKWDQSNFVNDLRNGAFDLVILRFDVNDPNHPDRSEDAALRIAGFNRFSDEMESAIAEGYELDTGHLFYSRRLWFVYRPKVRVP